MAAVFPVTSNGVFDTNPSYSGSFIPQLWSNKLNAKFYAHTMLSEVSNTDWEGEIKNQGDTIKIRTAPSITINDYEAGTGLTSEVPVPIIQDMQINQGKYFSVQINDVLSHQADMDLMNQFTDDAAKQLKISIENDCFFDWFATGAHAKNKGAAAGAISGAYNLGTDTAPVDQSKPADVLNAILGMSAAMDEQNIPEDGRWLIISPRDRNILMQSTIAQAYFTGDQSSTIRTGKIGMLDRMTVYVSNLLPKGGAAKIMVPGLSPTSYSAAEITAGATQVATLNSAKARRMMVAGTKHACAFASQITKTEPLRNQTDFGDIVRGLSVYGRKVIKPEALVTALVGVAS